LHFAPGTYKTKIERRRQHIKNAAAIPIITAVLFAGCGGNTQQSNTPVGNTGKW
jgi:hypothetical protein